MKNGKYDFRWDVLEIIISGKSSIDSLHGFNVFTLEDAERFLHSYGFDLDNPIEAAECLGHFHEAVNFIKRYFLQPENPDGLKLDVPRKILEISDIRDLFLYASLKHPSQIQDAAANRTLTRSWACSILKVMHTIAHIDQDIRTPHFLEIQKQILDRFYRVVHRNQNGKIILSETADDEHSVELEAFETKPKKGRDSTLLKLLHKPENVAEDIFDRIGIRFITPTPFECLRVIQFLQAKMIVVPPNIKPSRSRNTLLNLSEEKTRIESILEQFQNKNITELERDQSLRQTHELNNQQTDNPHTSHYYKSIQFTCRQLIKLKNPLYVDLKDLKSQTKTQVLPEPTLKAIEKLDLKFLQKEIKFFYPYEIQVVDKNSHEENEKGRSAHSEYKKAQLQTALKRVMGTLVNETQRS